MALAPIHRGETALLPRDKGQAPLRPLGAPTIGIGSRLAILRRKVMHFRHIQQRKKNSLVAEDVELRTLIACLD